MHHRHLQVFFEEMNDVEATPACAEHVDTIGPRMIQKGPARVGVDFRRGQTAHVGKIDLHAFHRQDIKAGLLKIAGKNIVDAADKVGHADEFFYRSEERRVGKECRSRWWSKY